MKKFFFLSIFFNSDDSMKGQEIRTGAGRYTNALLECDLAQDSISSERKNFSPELEAFVKNLKETGEVSEIAIYFRDLNNGPVIGINQSIPFAPASLLKVPLLIAYLQWIEEKPEVLTEKIFYTKPADVGIGQEFPPPDSLVEGRFYSVQELLKRMIQYSDNQSLILLYQHIPPSYEIGLFELLGIDTGILTDSTKRITVQQYSSFFRILYNASFLSFTHSEDALDLLAHISFVDGLRAGVPESIVVAHKFGERKEPNEQQQFHDCGIVYYPKYPYLLCIMTRGDDTQSLINAIKDISAFVYTQVDSQHARR
jgi:beta-lactamase class A